MENLKQLMTRRRFWYGLQLLLIFFLCLLGWTRGGVGAADFLRTPGDRIFNIAAVFLGMPSGIISLFTGQLATFELTLLTAAAYWATFVGIVEHVARKKVVKYAAYFLLLLMLLSFVGCARVVEIPQVIT